MRPSDKEFREMDSWKWGTVIIRDGKPVLIQGFKSKKKAKLSEERASNARCYVVSRRWYNKKRHLT
jgi:hypothetical protein